MYQIYKSNHDKGYSMKETNRKKRFMKIFRITLMIICGVILVLGGTASLLVHGYISKLNIVTAKNEEASGKLDTTEDLTESVQQNGEASTQSNTLNATVVPSRKTFSPSSFELSASEKASEPTAAPEAPEEEDETEVLSAGDPEVEAYLKAIKENINAKEDPIEDSNVLNILLIGSDTRDTDSQGRSDSIILITVNKEDQEITATSFLRDIYLQIPGKGQNRLIAAYAIGGAELLIDTLEQNFKIMVKNYVKVDFFTLIDIIDVMGGLTMEVSKDEIGVMNDYIQEMNLLLSEKKNKDTIKKAGTYLLNGKQVLAFSTNRYSRNGDFDRTDRQRKILQALYNKIYTLNPLEMNQLLNTILPQITTNIKEGEILLQLFSMPSYTEYKVKQFCIPVKDSFQNRSIRGMDVLCIDFQKNREQLKKELYHTH